MEPALYQTFAGLPFYVANPGLLPERTRAFEAGFQQNLFAGRWALNATYFNNLFHDQIEYGTNQAGLGQFFNVQKSLAHGAEVELQGRIWKKIVAEHGLQPIPRPSICKLRSAPRRIFAILCMTREIPCSVAPSSRQPRSSAIWESAGEQIWEEASWAAARILTFPPPEFLGINHAAGYARVDLGGWYAINSRITAYANVQNALNDHYNEVVGYPALTANFRAGVRLRIGGE